MTADHPPDSPEFEDRIQRAERGEAGPADAFQRLIGAIRADRTDRPGSDLLARIVAMGAPRVAESADGLPWWRAIESVVATLVGRTAPGDLVGVRSGAAATEHRAFETDDLAIDVAITMLDGDRCRVEGVIEAITPPVGDAEPGRLAAFTVGGDAVVVETSVSADGRFTYAHTGRPDRLVIDHRGRTAELRLTTEAPPRD